MRPLNDLRWEGGPGHYEVWFLTLTDRGSGLGIWIRFAMHAPLDGPADCSLWFAAMHRDGTRFGAREVFPADRLRGESDPFRLVIGDAELSGRGTAGGFGDVRWELRWTPGDEPGLPVHPLVERARLAKTMYVIPEPRIAIEGTVTFAGRTVELSGAHGAQAHLWGARHANSWGWAHAADLQTLAGTPAEGDWLDSISITAPRLGREVGPTTSFVGRLLGEPFSATSPAQVLRSKASSRLTSYRVTAQQRTRRVELEVDAVREALDRRGLRRPRRGPAALLEQRGRRPALPRLGPHAPRARRLAPAGDPGRARARLLRVRPARSDRHAADAHRRMSPVLPPLPEPFGWQRRADRGVRSPAARCCSPRGSTAPRGTPIDLQRWSEPAGAAETLAADGRARRRPRDRPEPPGARGARPRDRRPRPTCRRRRPTTTRRSRRCPASPASCAPPTACRSR